MAADVAVRANKCRLDRNECVSLLNILKSFNAPINEEHAWALCYQCAKCFKGALEKDSGLCRVVAELEQVILHRDGQVHPSTIILEQRIPTDEGASRLLGLPEHKVVAGLGLVLFKALDFGVEEDEERHLHPDLTKLIHDMIGSGRDETDDEGIVRDAGDCDDDLSFTTLSRVIQLCTNHVSQSADTHYRAVCRALVAEALELSSFLDKVSQGKVKTEASSDLQHLDVSIWARLWVQVIRELRHGVQLKKVCYSRTPIEYELTPYEILMDDIRSRRYKLNKVMVDGNLPHRVKKDAHAVILEFIRSRPPLRKASERQLAPRSRPQATPREQLLESIKQGQVKLRPSSSPLKRRVVPYDESTPSDTTPFRATRRLIKVDFSALQVDDEEEVGEGASDAPRTNPWQRTGTDVATLTRDQYLHYCDSALECTLPPQNAVGVATGCSIL